jgi:glycosyltransferase involved in cell wall biosynthesis
LIRDSHDRGRPLRVAIFQKRLANFRVPIFNCLAAEQGIRLDVLTAGLPGRDRTAFETRALQTVSFSIAGRRFVLQRHLLTEARKYDVLVVEGSVRFLSSLILVATAPFHRVPVVWWTSLYEPDVGKVMYPRGFKRVLLERLILRTKAVVAYSESAASAIQAALPKCPVFVAPNALDTDHLAAVERNWVHDRHRLETFKKSNGLGQKSVVLFVGRLIPVKRVADLLLAFADARCRRADLDAVLAIVGDGPERGRLEVFAAELGIANYVRFFGEIRDPEQICPFFLTARVLALPGAGGLAIYQALTHGVPVVATHADGTELDLIAEGQTGYLCEPGDTDGLSSRIIQFLDMPDSDWLGFSANCRRLTREKLHSRAMVEQLRAAVEYAASADSWGGPK